jgi:hypothetical protein
MANGPAAAPGMHPGSVIVGTRPSDALEHGGERLSERAADRMGRLLLRLEISKPEWFWSVVALAPALVFGAHALWNAQFTLIDDGWALYVAAQESPFGIGDVAGRFRPLYWLYNWLLVRTLPVAAWSFALGNAVIMTLTVWLLYRIGRRLSSRFGGLVAAWLSVACLPYVENLYTYGKQEPRHVLFWVLVCLVLARACEVRQRTVRAILVGILPGVACVLSKETGVLIAGPAAVIILAWWLTRRHATGMPASAAMTALAAALPAFAVTILLVVLSRRSGNYAQTYLSLGTGSWLHLSMFDRDAILTLLLTAGHLAALCLPLAQRGPRRIAYLALTAALLAQTSFFVLVPNALSYYLLTPAVLSALLAGCGADWLLASGRRWLVVGAVGLLAGCGLVSATRYAAALVGWSWLYGRLDKAVSIGRPARAFFHEAGSPEAHVEADLTWRRLHGIQVTVGVLDCSRFEPGIPCITGRDLRAGDWIIEQFGDPACNPRIPVRDLNAARSTSEALLAEGRSALPVFEIGRYRATFSCPVDLFRAHPTFLEWRIYRVTQTPTITWPGLPADGWLSANSRIVVQPKSYRALRFPLWAYLPRGTENRLEIRTAERLLATCGATPVPQDCEVPLDLARAEPSEWLELRLLPAACYVPRDYGMGDDPRCFSFNLSLARAAGGAVLVP